MACQARMESLVIGAVPGYIRSMPSPVTSPSAYIDARIRELADWRGQALARIRSIILAADPCIVEEVKWMGTPVWSSNGILCTGETYKSVVKLTFAKGASLPDPSGLFNSSLEGKVRRAIDIREGDTLHTASLTALIRAAVALNRAGKTKGGARAQRPKTPS